MMSPLRSQRMSLAAMSLAAILAAGLVAGPAQDSAPPVPRPDSGSPPIQVKEVVDALTIIVGIGNDEQRVRLHGVEPIRDRASSDKAVALLDGLLEGESVFLVRDRTDRGGGNETRAYVFRAPDGLFINLELVRQGLAAAATRGAHEHESVFRAYEQRAKRNGRGMWAPSQPTAGRPAAPPRGDAAGAEAEPDTAEPQPPSAADGDAVYVTPSGRKYHLHGCIYLRGAGKVIPLSDARKSHQPCSRCKPPQ